ncbi:MAG: SUMF1/EgtB/PvdO family nonheme iron enzyme [Magnetococcales bacterium]|nr:SUMF1/EgtB/PvdO family nonheme iron enzyme [Magnetococcales bacterium]
MTRNTPTSRQNGPPRRLRSRLAPGWAACGILALFLAGAAQGADLPPPALPSAEASPPLESWRDEGTGLTFLRLPGGCFSMGAADPALGARPVHRVCLPPFWLSRHETGNAPYAQCVADKACPAPERRDSGINEHFRTGDEDHYDAMGDALEAPNHPVVGVSWSDAQQFAQWLSRRTGKKFRLPTEAEWEYACRGGVGDAPSGQEAAPDAPEKIVGWFAGNSDHKTHPAGSLPANPHGLHDMLGNVWEWVQDHYDVEAYAHHPEHAPMIVRESYFHVTRGGSWSGPANRLHCAYRGVGEDRDRDDNLGFRLAMEP